MRHSIFQIKHFRLSWMPLIILISWSCSRQSVVTLDTMRPAEIDVAQNLKTLLIVDRTKFRKGRGNVLEGILTGELPEEDKAAVQALAQSLRSELNASPRFQIKVASERLEGNSITSAFPDQISWVDVNKLCKKYSADGLISVEMFDTDFVVTESRRVKTKTEKKDSLTRQVQEIEYYASGVNNIAIGIRLYNLRAGTIDDQQYYKRTNTWESTAASKAEALAKLISKPNASRYLSEQVGGIYAFRIAPMPIQISRYFKSKAKKAPELEQGTRYAEVADWTRAIEIWKKGIGKAPSKEAGFLAYNIAVGYEVLGNMEVAKHWARKSYTQFGNKEGRNYITLLDNRIRDESIADNQMN